MAENQLENGYTRISNQTLEAMAKARLSGREWCVIMAIWRQTYGWNRTDAKISLSDLEKLTGISRRHCIEVVASLSQKKMVECRKEGSCSIYSFQKDYDVWNFGKPACSRNGEFPKSGIPETGNTSVPETGNTSVPETGNTYSPETPDLFGGSESLKTIKDNIKTLPRKNRGGKKKSDTANKVNPWAVWVDVHRRIARVDPVAISPDTSAAKRAFAALGSDPEKLEMCFENFLYDDDNYLASSGWALRDILKRLNKYLSQGKAYFDMNGERCSYQKWLEEEERIKKFALEAEQDKIKNERLDREWRQRMEEAAKEKKEAPIVKRLLAHINATV